MKREREAGPGPREEQESAPADRPHVTENDRGAQAQGSTQAPDDVPVLPANAHGRDRVPAEDAVPEIDDESMYGRRPGEDKDRRKTDMP